MGERIPRMRLTAYPPYGSLGMTDSSRRLPVTWMRGPVDAAEDRRRGRNRPAGWPQGCGHAAAGLGQPVCRARPRRDPQGTAQRQGAGRPFFW